jgi:hypothetical protein
MNDPFVAGQARQWAERALQDVDLSPHERVSRLYEAAFARPATSDEAAAAVEFLQTQGAELKLPGDAWQRDARVWADLCHVLFNVKGFIFMQ